MTAIRSCSSSPHGALADAHAKDSSPGSIILPPPRYRGDVGADDVAASPQRRGFLHGLVPSPQWRAEHDYSFSSTERLLSDAYGATVSPLHVDSKNGRWRPEEVHALEHDHERTKSSGQVLRARIHQLEAEVAGIEVGWNRRYADLECTMERELRSACSSPTIAAGFPALVEEVEFLQADRAAQVQALKQTQQLQGQEIFELSGKLQEAQALISQQRADSWNLSLRNIEVTSLEERGRAAEEVIAGMERLLQDAQEQLALQLCQPSAQLLQIAAQEEVNRLELELRHKDEELRTARREVQHLADKNAGWSLEKDRFEKELRQKHEVKIQHLAGNQPAEKGSVESELMQKDQDLHAAEVQLPCATNSNPLPSADNDSLELELRCKEEKLRAAKLEMQQITGNNQALAVEKERLESEMRQKDDELRAAKVEIQNITGNVEVGLSLYDELRSTHMKLAEKDARCQIKLEQDSLRTQLEAEWSHAYSIAVEAESDSKSEMQRLLAEIRSQQIELETARTYEKELRAKCCKHALTAVTMTAHGQELGAESHDLAQSNSELQRALEAMRLREEDLRLECSKLQEIESQSSLECQQALSTAASYKRELLQAPARMSMREQELGAECCAFAESASELRRALEASRLCEQDLRMEYLDLGKTQKHSALEREQESAAEIVSHQQSNEFVLQLQRELKAAHEREQELRDECRNLAEDESCSLQRIKATLEATRQCEQATCEEKDVLHLEEQRLADMESAVHKNLESELHAKTMELKALESAMQAIKLQELRAAEDRLIAQLEQQQEETIKQETFAARVQSELVAFMQQEG